MQFQPPKGVYKWTTEGKEPISSWPEFYPYRIPKKGPDVFRRRIVPEDMQHDLLGVWFLFRNLFKDPAVRADYGVLFLHWCLAPSSTKVVDKKKKLNWDWVSKRLGFPFDYGGIYCVEDPNQLQAKPIEVDNSWKGTVPEIEKFRVYYRYIYDSSRALYYPNILFFWRVDLEQALAISPSSTSKP